MQTLENFEISKSLGFTVHGVGPKYRKRAARMQPEDRILCEHITATQPNHLIVIDSTDNDNVDLEPFEPSDAGGTSGEPDCSTPPSMPLPAMSGEPSPSTASAPLPD